MTKNPATVLTWVSKKTGVPSDDILSQNRVKRVVSARAQVAHILRVHMKFSYPEIGRFLDKDSSTAIHLVKNLPFVFSLDEVLDINDDP